MNIKYKTVLIILLIIILFGIVIWQAITCRRSSCDQITDTNEFCTQSEAKDIARNWILTNSETYKFDGYDLDFKSVKLMKCVSCYQFTYSFKSKYAGYGNRAEQELIEKTTTHNIVIGASKGQIIEAITDGKYDEMKQQLLTVEITPAIPVDSSTGSVAIANPASVYCEQKGGSLEIRDFVDGQTGFCVFEDGSECEEWKFFRQECKMGQRLCQDFCGDGTCQELVCMAIGCPCAESSENCLIDCAE